MKKLPLTLLALALLLMPAHAQDVSYALPYTTVIVEVDAVKDYHFAGPYAAYAKELLNLNVPVKDKVETRISEIRIRPVVEADPWSPRYSCPAGNSTFLEMTAQGLVSFRDNEEAAGATLRFSPQVKADFSGNGITGPNRQENQIVYKTVHTDTADVRYPVEQSVLVAKTLEDKAAAAAETILTVRNDRYNIAIGNTDASFSGGSLAAALEELTKIEQENLLMFTGYKAKGEAHATFEVMPSATARTHRYTAFYLTEDGKLSKEGKGRAVPYELEFTPVSIPDVASEPSSDAKKKGQGAVGTVHYRIPAVCRVRLLEDGVTILETRIPVYQLGREAEMPITVQ